MYDNAMLTDGVMVGVIVNMILWYGGSNVAVQMPLVLLLLPLPLLPRTTTQVVVMMIV